MRVVLLAVVYAGLLRKQAPQIDYTSSKRTETDSFIPLNKS